ncbi:MAG: carboxymuconolactone decarboxylase family protein [Pseudomonadales bacterium]
MENGLTEEKISALDAPDGVFSDRERAALNYAEKLAVDHHAIDDGYFDDLRVVFNDAEILELGMMIGQYIGFGRLLKVLDLEPKFCPTD